MEYGLETVSSGSSLFRELRNWNGVEDMMLQTFKEVTPHDRDFRKMKLREYDRLYLLYNGKTVSADEKALLAMLRFQRRKMERALYPGLLRRTFRRAAVLLSPPIDIKKELAMARQDAAAYYSGQKLPDLESGAGKRESRQEKEERYEPKHRYGQDLGRRKEQAQQSNGHSI